MSVVFKKFSANGSQGALFDVSDSEIDATLCHYRRLGEVCLERVEGEKALEVRVPLNLKVVFTEVNQL